MKATVFVIFVLAAVVAANPASVNEPPRPLQEHQDHMHEVQDEDISSKIDISQLSSALLERIPNAAQVMGMTQEQVQSRNGEEFINSFDEVCNAGLMYGSIKPNFAPSKEQIELHLMTVNGEISGNLNQPQKICDEPALQQEKQLVIFITGLKSTEQSNPQKTLWEAYKCRGNSNFLVIDLGKHITNVQALVTLNTEHVGEWIGDLLVDLSKKVPINQFHLIGHGLGAHVAGAASRKFTDLTGNQLPRLTGLDPAVICNKPTSTLPGLQKGDAEFVDVIHSSTYGYGKPEALGDVDFYPNGPSILQPGSKDLITSHNMAVQFYAETVIPGNEHNFPAQQCNSIKNLQSKICQRQQIPMGLLTPKNACGNFFLQTNTVYPFGHNASQTAKGNSCWKN